MTSAERSGDFAATALVCSLAGFMKYIHYIRRLRRVSEHGNAGRSLSRSQHADLEVRSLARSDRVVVQGQNANVGQVAVALGVIQAEAHDKFIGNRETNVVRLDRRDAALGLVQQNGDAHLFWLALLKNVQEVAQRKTGVENVLDDDDGFSFDAGIEIARESYLSGSVRAFAVAGDGNHVERHFAGNMPGEIGKKEHRALEDADKMQRFVGKVRANLLGQLRNALLNPGAWNQDANFLATWKLDSARCFRFPGHRGLERERRLYRTLCAAARLWLRLCRGRGNAPRCRDAVLLGYTRKPENHHCSKL